jgi:fused signal recognition particle receptor
MHKRPGADFAHIPLAAERPIQPQPERRNAEPASQVSDWDQSRVAEPHIGSQSIDPDHGVLTELQTTSLAERPGAATQQRNGWVRRLSQGLAKSSRSLTVSIGAIFTKRRLDTATLEELEDVLIQADLGVEMTTRIVTAVASGRYEREIGPDEVKAILANEIAKVLKPVEVPFNFGAEKPFVILVVGVNGSGKTTTIGKLARRLTGEGHKLMLAAGDTFRAAAIEQLQIWGERNGVPVIAQAAGADPAAVIFDALQAAQARGADVLIADTAGRLHTQSNLMEELKKVKRVLGRLDPSTPHEVLLVLDAGQGQNALAQAQQFHEALGVTGIVLTKLDGTAKGGIVLAIADRLGLPLRFVGVGETAEDFGVFDAETFVDAVLAPPRVGAGS